MILFLTTAVVTHLLLVNLIGKDIAVIFHFKHLGIAFTNPALFLLGLDQHSESFRLASMRGFIAFVEIILVSTRLFIAIESGASRENLSLALIVVGFPLLLIHPNFARSTGFIRQNFMNSTIPEKESKTQRRCFVM